VITAKNVLVCGYPKSGTNWLSRLVAELAGCPLRGNWGYPCPPPEAVDGMERRSDFACYKSHHECSTLVEQADVHAVVYIVRDPRDVVISACHQFELPFSGLANVLRRIPLASRVYPRARSTLNALLPVRIQRRRMIEAILDGDTGISAWLAVPWKDHVAAFADSGCCIVQYEQLLHDPLRACRDILAHLGVERSDAAILAAIDAHAFSSRKHDLKRAGIPLARGFLREGRTGYWRVEFTAAEKRRFIERLGHELRRWSYPLE